MFNGNVLHPLNIDYVVVVSVFVNGRVGNGDGFCVGRGMA